MENHWQKVAKMRDEVKSELEHIPRGDINQNFLRQFYWLGRMHSFKTGENKEGVLEHAIQMIKKDTPGFVPKYDTEFFKMKQ